jgi:hypothetical protein
MTKNTASQTIGAQMVSATDGSAFTGAVTVAVTGDAGTQATGSVGAGACTHEGNGYHTYAPAQAETNYDLIAFTFTGTGAVPTTVQVFTTGYAKSLANAPANVTQFGGSAGTFSGGRPEVNTTHWGGTAVASAVVGANVAQISGDSVAADNAEAFFDGTGYAGTGNVIPTVTTLTNAPSDSSGVTTLLSRVPSGIFTGITSLAQWLGLIAGKQTGNSTARTEIRATGAGSGTFDETTDSQEAVRDRGDAAWTTATGFSTHSAADVWASATRVLTAATNISGPIADQVWEEAIADHSGTAGSTAEALNAAGSAGDPWTTALPGAYTSGQAGKIIGDNINATISSRATPAQVATELGTYDAPTKAELDSAVALLATAANLATLTTTVGVAGAGLTEAGGTGDHLTAINLPDQTMNITGDITGSLSGSVGSVTGAVGSVTGAVGSVTGAVGSVTGAVGSVTGNVGGNVTGSVGSLATQAKADVNAEVVDALSTDTYAEPAAVPAATATLAAKVGWLAALARNKVTQTATTQTLRNDADSADVATSTVSDDGTTYTRGEFT